MQGASGGRAAGEDEGGGQAGTFAARRPPRLPSPPVRRPSPAPEGISSVHLNAGLVPPPGGRGGLGGAGPRLIPPRPPARAGGAASPRGAPPNTVPLREEPAPPPASRSGPGAPCTRGRGGCLPGLPLASLGLAWARSCSAATSPPELFPPH